MLKKTGFALLLAAGLVACDEAPQADLEVVTSADGAAVTHKGLVVADDGRSFVVEVTTPGGVATGDVLDLIGGIQIVGVGSSVSPVDEGSTPVFDGFAPIGEEGIFLLDRMEGYNVFVYPDASDLVEENRYIIDIDFDAIAEFEDSCPAWH